jgi:hypothetical protein
MSALQVVRDLAPGATGVKVAGVISFVDSFAFYNPNATVVYLKLYGDWAGSAPHERGIQPGRAAPGQRQFR